VNILLYFSADIYFSSPDPAVFYLQSSVSITETLVGSLLYRHYSVRRKPLSTHNAVLCLSAVNIASGVLLIT
jgi:hypothetical protein